MRCFSDINGSSVQLTFKQSEIVPNAQHVWVICRYKNEWLLTNHKTRGLEFPGGKVEPGEDSEMAAIREVKEETGASIKQLFYLGQYKVISEENSFYKDIYFAVIDQIKEQCTYFETKGPRLLDTFPVTIETDDRFSFLMKDHVLKLSLEQIYEQKLCEKGY